MNEAELSNKINNAPIELIEAQDIIDFCEIQREEGIDLDYKANFPADLAKVICSFANTQGGIILIGVGEEGKTRKPKLPIDGIEEERSSIHQRIMNIASDGIYPPVSPEVRICELPEHNRKNVIVIRVLQSKWMHSTDRRRKIYVRVADNSRGYDLASVPDLEWLWERKVLSEEKRKEIYRLAIEHSESTAIPWRYPENEEHWKIVPKLHVSIIPSFPNPDNSIETDELLRVVRSLPQTHSTWTNVSRFIPWDINYWRSIPGGVCLSSRGYRKDLEYIEFGQMAHVHATFGVETRNTRDTVSEPIDFTWAYIILSYVDITLKFAYKFFDAIKYSWPITIEAIFESSDLIKIDYTNPSSSGGFMRSENISTYAPDKNLQLLSFECTPDRMIEEKSLMLTAAYNLFWAFGLGWDKSKVLNWLERLPTKEH